MASPVSSVEIHATPLIQRREVKMSTTDVNKLKDKTEDSREEYVRVVKKGAAALTQYTTKKIK